MWTVRLTRIVRYSLAGHADVSLCNLIGVGVDFDQRYGMPERPEGMQTMIDRIAARLAFTRRIGAKGLPLVLLASAIADAAPAHAQTPLPAAVQREIAASAKACSGGRFERENGFVTRIDVNADGRPDYFLNYEHASCSNLASGFCGTGGCTLQLFVSRKNGSYAKALDRNIRKLSFSETGPAFRATLILHGTHCDLPGYKDCREELRWNGRELKPLSIKPDEE